MIFLSVVIPVYNEEEIIPELTHRLESVLKGIGKTYEILFVNDGSQDRSREILKDLAARNGSVRVIELSRNFGLQVAYSAGMDHATGNGVVVMDGDLQDPPELIPQLVEKWQEGYDVVYTKKTERKESFFKRLAFASFYRILRLVSSVEMPMEAGSFSLMDRRVVQVLKSLTERNRLLSGLRAWTGFRQTEVPFKREARYKGCPRQTFSKLLKMALDGLFSFSTVPVRIATFFGFVVCGLALAAIVTLLFLRIFTDWIMVTGWTSLIITIIFFGGVQLIFVGILGEYVCRILEEVRARPLYLIKEKIGFDSKT